MMNIDSDRCFAVQRNGGYAIDFNALMATCYRRTPPLPIRTFDTLHLASARVSGETEIVATDK